MQHKQILGAMVLALVAAHSYAADLSAGAGSDYVFASGNVNAKGLGVTADWLHSDDEGDVAALGLGIGLPLGPALATVGGKLVYLGPRHADDGAAAAFGGSLEIPMGTHFRMIGAAYYSPDSLSSGIKAYEEASLAVRFNATRMVGVEVGYRYMKTDGKDGDRDTTFANGAYGGVSLSF